MVLTSYITELQGLNETEINRQQYEIKDEKAKSVKSSLAADWSRGPKIGFKFQNIQEQAFQL